MQIGKEAKAIIIAVCSAEVTTNYVYAACATERDIQIDNRLSKTKSIVVCLLRCLTFIFSRFASLCNYSAHDAHLESH